MTKHITGTSERPFFQVIAPGACQKVSFTGTSARSAQLGASSQIVRLYATQDCWVAIGTSSIVAAANNGTAFFLPKGTLEHLVVDGGTYVAAIQDSAAGDLHITEAA